MPLVPVRSRRRLSVLAALLAGGIGAAGAGAAPALGATSTPRIVGGVAAAAGAWPFAAYYEVDILGSPHAACTGELIDPSWILTAAHCVLADSESNLGAGSTWPAGDISVVLGETHITRGLTGVPVSARPVDQLVADPSYDAHSGANDLGLVHLTQPAAGLTPVRPVNPGEEALWSAGTQATVIGWGATTEQGPASNDLLQTNVPIVGDPTCVQDFEGFDSSSQLCAGDVASGGRDACAGDSGGPLVVPNGQGGAWRLAGVVSEGIGCGRPGKPGIYARVGAAALRNFLLSTSGASYPIAAFAVSPTIPRVGERVALHSVSAHQPAGVGLSSFGWDLSGTDPFADASGPTINATFATAGPHVVRLQVTDASGVSDQVAGVVNVNPAAPLGAPPKPHPSTRAPSRHRCRTVIAVRRVRGHRRRVRVRRCASAKRPLAHRRSRHR